MTKAYLTVYTLSLDINYAQDGMVSVVSKRCSHENCSKISLYGLESTRRAKFCMQHAQDGLVNVVEEMLSRTLLQDPIVRIGEH